MGRAFRKGDEVTIPPGTPIVFWSGGKGKAPPRITRRVYQVILTDVTANAWDGPLPRLYWDAGGYLRAVELTAAIYEANP